MKPRHHVSRRAIELIKSFEGYRRKAAVLADGRWTIGFGHVKTARADVEVSEADAEALLLYDLMAVSKAVNDWTFTPLTGNQFDALVCFAFNIGLDAFRSSSVLRLVNEGGLLQAACALEMWRKADFEGERIVVDALVRRRAAEKALFLTPSAGWVPAPTPVIQPRIDNDAPSTQPVQEPVHLTVPLDGGEAAAQQGVEPIFDEEDDSTSPATQAAEKFAARLQALVPDAEDAPADRTDADAAPFGVVSQDDQANEIQVPTEIDPDDHKDAAPEPGSERLTIEEPQAFPAPPFNIAASSAATTILLEDHSNRDPDRDEGISLDAGLAAYSPPRTDFKRVLGFGAAGLACFALAVAWSIFAGPGSAAVGWIAGLAGTGFVIAAVYLLLERLGGSED